MIKSCSLFLHKHSTIDTSQGPKYVFGVIVLSWLLTLNNIRLDFAVLLLLD